MRADRSSERILAVEKKSFGKLPDGTEVFLYSFTNSNQMTMTVTDLGATLVSLLVPDRDHNPVDVVLGYDTPGEYIKNNTYFGAVVGRNANRIENGRFSIGNKSYQLPKNDGENNLHSGPNGFESRKWEVAETDESAGRISFHLLSPDGDNGFPGNFDLTVSYTLTDEDAVVIHYRGFSDADTIANVTNHSYFNLAGHASGSIEDHLLTLTASSYTPLRDSSGIPSGEVLPAAGTPMDFTKAKPIGADIGADFDQLKLAGGYDHNYVLPENGGALKKIAEVYCRESGITMDVVTDCCCVQFYTANFITDQRGKYGVTYHKRQGFCLETQYAPNAVNEPGFDSPLLSAGEPYETETRYRFFTKDQNEDF